jgi:hypothetical protein
MRVVREKLGGSASNANATNVSHWRDMTNEFDGVVGGSTEGQKAAFDGGKVDLPG